jgi:hypothetical protein
VAYSTEGKASTLAILELLACHMGSQTHLLYHHSCTRAFQLLLSGSSGSQVVLRCR